MGRNDNSNTQGTGSASQSYIDLATLLQKKRSPEKKLQVEKILASDMPVHVMIEQIEQIDNDYRLGRPRQEERKQEDVANIISNAGQIPADTAEKNRKTLKRKLRKNDTLSFIFYDFRKIIHFIKNAGRRSDYMRHSFFPPRIRLNRRIQYLFETVFQKQAGELYLTLNKVLREGWLHLTKLEYNLVVQFTNLCSEVLNINFHGYDLKDENIIDKIYKLETLFITCHYRQEYPAIILSAVTTVIERYPEWNVDLFAVKNNITRLLDQKQSRPSLQNLILAMNMIKYKRYLSFNDLFQSGMLDIINTFDFECDIVTSRRIKDYTEKTLQELLTLMKEKMEIDKLTRFLPFSPDGSFNYKILELFYEKSFQNKNFNYTRDKEYTGLFAQNFFQLFLEMYEQFLSGKLELESGSSVKIFSTDFFQIETSKIHSLIEKISKYAYAFEKFPDERYLALVSSKKAGTQTEAELVQLIKEFLTTAKSLGDKLMDVERCHRPEHQATSDGKDIPLEPSMLLKRIVRIPHRDERVASPPHLRGQQVMAVLSDIITLCLITVVFFHDREIPILLSKKDRIDKDIHGFRQTLERVTNIIEMKSIEGKYGI